MRRMVSISSLRSVKATTTCAAARATEEQEAILADGVRRIRHRNRAVVLNHRRRLLESRCLRRLRRALSGVRLGGQMAYIIRDAAQTPNA